MKNKANEIDLNVDVDSLHLKWKNKNSSSKLSSPYQHEILNFSFSGHWLRVKNCIRLIDEWALHFHSFHDWSQLIQSDFESQFISDDIYGKPIMTGIAFSSEIRLFSISSKIRIKKKWNTCIKLKTRLDLKLSPKFIQSFTEMSGENWNRLKHWQIFIHITFFQYQLFLPVGYWMPILNSSFLHSRSIFH